MTTTHDLALAEVNRLDEALNARGIQAGAITRLREYIALQVRITADGQALVPDLTAAMYAASEAGDDPSYDAIHNTLAWLTGDCPDDDPDADEATATLIGALQS